MKINSDDLVLSYYEDDKGNKCISNFDDSHPEGYRHLIIIDLSIRTKNYIIAQKKDIEKCSHIASISEKNGYEFCEVCLGKRFYDSEEWHCGSLATSTFRSTYNSEVVLALSRPSLKQKLYYTIRNKKKPKIYTLDEAIIIATTACERCVNTLAYQYGCSYGYPEMSDEWFRANTKCKFCAKMPNEKVTTETRLRDLL